MSTRARHVAFAVGACVALVACTSFSGENGTGSPAPIVPGPDAGTTDGAPSPPREDAGADGGEVAGGPCADAPFREDFEAASIPSAWTIAGATDIDFLLSTERKASGAQSLRVTVHDAPSDHGRKLVRPIAGKCIDVEWSLFVAPSVSPDGTTVFSVDFANGDQLIAFIGGTRVYFTEQGGTQAQVQLFDVALPTTAFTSFRVRITPGATANDPATVDLHVGGASAGVRSTAHAFKGTATASLAIGAPFAYAGKTGELWLDDVVVR